MGIELSRSAAVCVAGSYSNLSAFEREGEWRTSRRPRRASPRPLAAVLGCLAAACAPAGIVPPSSGQFLVVWSRTKGAFVMTPLRKRMLEDLQIRNYSPNAVAAYIRRVAEFAKHFAKSPELLGPEEIREYQLYLIKDKTVSLSAYIQTVCGPRFLYSNTLHRSVSIDRIPLPRYEKKLPVILNPAEVQRLLETPKNLSHRTMLTTMYAAAPRAPESAR